MKQFALLLVIGILPLTTSCRYEDYSSDLKKAIEEKSFYDGQKDVRISELKTVREQLGGADLTLEYTINDRIAEEYSQYKLDSAICYIERNRNIAEILNNMDHQIESSFKLAKLYSNSGLFLESKLLLESIRRNIPEKFIADYYKHYAELYDSYHLFSQREDHRKIKEAYHDSLRIISGCAILADARHSYTELHQNLSASGKWTSDYSFNTYYLAQYHEENRQLDSAKYYYTLSSISDLRNSNKDQGSMIKLARLCYEDEEYTEAYEYFRSTMEDAIKGNMKTRTMRVSEPFTLINDTFQAQEDESRKVISTSLVIICILLIVLFFLLYNIYRKIRETRKAKQEIQEINAIISEQNIQLMEQKEILEKVNFVQEKYIAYFFELSSIHLSKMESYQHSLRKLMTSGKMDDLNRELKSNEMLENELHEQHVMFDKIFLDLYPTFVEDFNALLEPENKIVLKPGELMNTEIRIYALMRLGFIDSTKIASFLHCSMSTIYTYHTKSRNRSSLSREEFDAAVMRIGTTHK